MDRNQFDSMTAALGSARTRRGALGLLAASAGLALPGLAAAKKKKKKKKCLSAKGSVTLQQAIDAALPGATIKLCKGTFNGNVAYSGGGTITIVGAGSAKTILKGDGTNSVFSSDKAANNVTLQNLQITGGSAQGVAGANQDGGGIYNLGTMRVVGCLVTGNSAQNTGGGIGNFNTGNLTLDATVVSRNSADSGGGISNQATLAVTNGSVIGGATDADGNTSTSYGGGISNAFGTATFATGTLVTHNTAGVNFGAGIYNQCPGGSVTLADPGTVTANTPTTDQLFGGTC